MNNVHAYAAIAALDLSTVRTRLMHHRAGLGWSAARTLAVESDYREFLLLAKTRPTATPSPTADVDAFWHFHILDTMKYARDCALVFGHFLHHQPDVAFADETASDIEAQAAGAASAYCAVTQGPAENDAALAYCAVAQPAAIQSRSYCAIARPAERITAAYCAVTRAAQPATMAYCAIARPAAYCAVAAHA